MFDKLIESEPAGADFKNRRRYFLVSMVIVGALFATAVVASIYASDYSLGSGSFELEAMLMPVEMAAAAPVAPKPQRLESSPSSSKSELPTRMVNMARTDEPIVPDGISTERNNFKARPIGNFKISDADTNPSGSGRDLTGTDPGGVSQLTANTNSTVEKDPVIDLPPAKVPAKKVDVVQSLGVINGKASYLPKPAYPSAAIAVNAQGAVNVQVLIDETGRVVAANAAGGHPLLRQAAEQAARNAKFTPTYLSKVPVKVSGVIVYNFVR